MATYGAVVRRGLPRRPGDDAWPPAGDAPVDVATAIAEPIEVAPATPAVAAPNTIPDASSPRIAPHDVTSHDVARPVASVRRGLPRVPGGEPWPPAGFAAAVGARTAPQSASVTTSAGKPQEPTAEASTRSVPQSDSATTTAAATQDVTAEGSAPRVAASARATEPRPVRRGLPRAPGGEPWPPSDFAATATVAGTAPQSASATTSAAEQQELTAEASTESGPQSTSAATTTVAAQEVTAQASAARASTGSGPAEPLAVRRGLPRVPGGEPWPPSDFAAAIPLAPSELEAAGTPAPAETIVVEQVAPDDAVSTDVVGVEASGVDVSIPLPFTRTVWQGAAAERFESEQRAGVKLAMPEPKRIGPFNRLQWAGIVVVGGGGLLYAAAMAVVLVRWLLSTQWGIDFLAAYPGEYHLPEGAPVGLPAWLGWQHFFNAFLIVLIIRSGLQVRTEKRPTAFWSPRDNPRRKISLNLWFHQSLDLLWVVNGLAFVVLLFVTGQWMRIVPTSWEVFPNALSAILQYISLDWPTENGWVNYNSIQQIAYFTTVFLAAPLAIATGVRMSGIWPKDAKALNKAYPVEWARAVHFPVMLYFVAFIAVHVFLVFATGALRNLNHMYAAQGSTDPNAYADNWAGFWWFFASLVVIAAAWIAARPLVLAPIARLFGNVSGR